MRITFAFIFKKMADIMNMQLIQLTKKLSICNVLFINKNTQGKVFKPKFHDAMEISGKKIEKNLNADTMRWLDSMNLNSHLILNRQILIMNANKSCSK